MHSALIAGAFLAMVFAPCVVATCSKYFPMRLHIRFTGPRTQAHRAPTAQALDPLLLAIQQRRDVHSSPSHTPHAR